MNRHAVVAASTASLLLLSARVEAQPKPAAERSPEEVTTGEVRVTMNSDYAKLQVDGADWEAHEFVDQGRTVIIHGLDRTQTHQVRLIPVNPGLAEIEFDLKPDDWKLVRIDKKTKTLMWRVERKLTFPKATPANPAP